MGHPVAPARLQLCRHPGGQEPAAIVAPEAPGGPRLEIRSMMLSNMVSHKQRHEYEKMLPFLDKEGQRWRKPARGGWNARRTHRPSHGLHPWHPLNRGGDQFVNALALTYV